MDSFSSISTDNGESVFRDVGSEDGSRPTSPISTTVKDDTVGSNGNVTVTKIDSATDPNASLKFDIRAHSVTAQDAFQEAVAKQSDSRAQLGNAEKGWKQEPIYNFTQRTQLYNASVKAQIKFSKSTSIVRLEQMHVAYLETLSKSALSPEEQHAAYSKFKITLADACQKRVNADIEEERSVGCSPNVRKYFAAQDAALKTEATDAEKEVRNLLKEIQQPHTESRHTIAQVLRYREVQWHQTTDKNSTEAKKLQADISAIRSFQAAGGLDSLTQPESTELNALFKDATTKYNAWKKEDAAYKSEAINKAGPLHKAEQAFEEADAAVMTTIRELGGNLKGPPELRKNLVATLRHKEALQASATGDEAAKLNEEVATLKAFLSSRQLAALNSKAPGAKELTLLMQEADKKYVTWQQLETITNSLQAEATKAAAEAEKKATAATATASATASTEKAVDPAEADTSKTPQQTPVEIAAQATDAAQAASQKATAAATQARERANAAKTLLKEADDDVMRKITLFAPPEVFYATNDSGVFSSTLPTKPSEYQQSSPAAATAIPLPENELPLAEDASTEERAATALSTSSTASATSTSVSPEDVRSLWKFTEKLQNSRFPAGAKLSESSKKQLASLEKFLALDEVVVAALPPEKLKNLADRMKEIKEKEKQRVITPRDQLSNIQTEIADSETQFIAALEK